MNAPVPALIALQQAKGLALPAIPMLMKSILMMDNVLRNALLVTISLQEASNSFVKSVTPIAGHALESPAFVHLAEALSYSPC